MTFVRQKPRSLQGRVLEAETQQILRRTLFSTASRGLKDRTERNVHPACLIRGQRERLPRGHG